MEKQFVYCIYEKQSLARLSFPVPFKNKKDKQDYMFKLENYFVGL